MVAASASSQRDSDLLRGVLDMAVLALLAVEPGHAYAVVDRLRSSGFASAGYGTIYPLVTRLRRSGLLTQEAVASPDGPNRQVLTVAPSGHEALAEWRSRWESTTSAVATVLAELDRSGARRV